MLKMLSKLEIATMLRVDVVAVQHWIAAGKLKAVRVGKAWRIHPEALQAFLDAGNAPDPGDQLEVEVAAQQLGTSVDAVRRLLRGGKLPGGKVGSVWRVSKAGLEAFTRAGLPPKTDPPPAAEAGSHGAGGHPAAAPVGVDRAARTERAAGNDKPRRVAGGR